MKKLIKAISIDKISTISLVKFAIFIIIASLAPILNSQPITGTIVNATLFISTISLGIHSAIFIAFVPSLIALVSGFLPIIMAPMIPFIIISNIILVIIFNYLKSNYWVAILTSSFFKFIFLSLTSYLMMNLFLSERASFISTTMMSWAQLLTALSGGIIAYIFLNQFSPWIFQKQKK